MKKIMKIFEDTQRLMSWIIVIGVLIAGMLLWRVVSEGRLSMGTDNAIDVTPTQIESIKAIGEWEFLSISDEELVDTVRHRLFSKDELARIYYGTLRLGIDMQQMEEGWLTVSGDTVVVRLPQVRLLDENFIDEARTKSFFESGRWNAKAREALYQKAKRQMLQHCMTPQNLETAQQNAEAQVKRLLRSMGFKEVRIAEE